MVYFNQWFFDFNEHLQFLRLVRTNATGRNAGCATVLESEVFHEFELVLDRARDIAHYFNIESTHVGISDVTKAVGLAHSAALRKLLVARRLPPFESFRDWCYVVQLADRFSGAEAIAGWALAHDRDPAPYYRLIRRVTRRAWSEVKTLPSPWTRRMALREWSPHLSSPDSDATGS